MHIVIHWNFKQVLHMTPPWPSLYNPGLEILNIEHRQAVQPGGTYLYSADGQWHLLYSWHLIFEQHVEIFRFTFYWTLIFYTPLFFVCGFYAFCNYIIPPQRSLPQPLSYPSEESPEYEYRSDHEMTILTNDRGAYMPLRLLKSRCSWLSPRVTPTSRSTMQAPKRNERRSRVTFALLLFLVFLALGLAGAVIGSAVLGFAAMGLYRAGNFNMSTSVIRSSGSFLGTLILS